jgi:hypothetical protein
VDAEAPAADLVAPLVVEAARSLSLDQLTSSDGEPVPNPSASNDLTGLLGEEVLVQVPSGSPRRAILHSLNGQFSMPVGRNPEPTFVYGALELGSRDGTPVTRAGDAGAVVSTLAGDPIGIVICGFEDVSFAAPIGKLAGEERAWEPVSTEIAERWNKRVARDAGLDPQARALRDLIHQPEKPRAAEPSEASEWTRIAEKGDQKAMTKWSREARRRLF